MCYLSIMSSSQSSGVAAVTGEKLDLFFGEVSRPVRLFNCSGLVELFAPLFPGWTIRRSAAGSEIPIITVTFADGDYRIDGEWVPQNMQRSDPVDAICALIAELVRAYVLLNDQLLCLHGAAVEFSGRLVVFPSQYRAGKSVLTAALAARGCRVFGDDVLPLQLQDGVGMAPGLAPRLRIPLPDNLEKGTRSFIDRHRRLGGEHYQYLELDDNTLAPRGSKLAVGAFVLLERQPGAHPSLEPVADADVLKQVVWQNFAREADAGRILKLLNRMVKRAGGYRLRYDRAEDAARLLQEYFSRWETDCEQAESFTSSMGGATAEAAKVARGCYLRKAEIDVVMTDEQIFLADSNGAAIYHLNTIGSAIWSLLAEPMTQQEICEVLLSAFPDLEPDLVRADVAGLCETLVSRKLLLTGAE